MRIIGIALLALSVCAGADDRPAEAKEQVQPAGHVIGKASSSEALTVGTTELAAGGIQVWPVAVGDDLKTKSAKASIQLKDKSSVVLDKRTSVKVASLGGERGLFHLKAGGMLINAAADSVVGVCVVGIRFDAIGPAEGIVQVTSANQILVKAQGSFVIDPKRSCTTPGVLARSPSAVKTALVQGAGAGGTVTVVADAVTGGGSVSPSQPQ